MEREFGTKSYQPEKFDFYIMFKGMANMEYQQLFDRKLPGNILVSTYHIPMTIRQLAIELGVASVYLEDEIALLERYRLLTALPGGRYQARLVILTEEYMEEFFRTAEKSVMSDVKEILGDVAKKLPKLRELRFAGSNLEDNPLLWALLFELTRRGWGLFKAAREEAFSDTGLYSKGDICYGSTYSMSLDHPYETMGFAGYAGFRPDYAACYADYCVLPVKNRFSSHRNEIAGSLDSVLAGETEAMAPVFDKEQMKEVSEILREEIASFAGLYESLYGCAISVMQIHAPEAIREIVEPVTANVLFSVTVGLIGGLAVKSGALANPEDDRPLGGFVYRV